MSTPAPHEDVLGQAASPGHQYGEAAVYWQTGDIGTGTAAGFYWDLLRGIAGAGPQIKSLYHVPGLIAQHDYDRDNLAADLGLAAAESGSRPAAQRAAYVPRTLDAGPEPGEGRAACTAR